MLYRRIFGRSRPVTVEFLGVWVSCLSLSTSCPPFHLQRQPKNLCDSTKASHHGGLCFCAALSQYSLLPDPWVAYNSWS